MKKIYDFSRKITSLAERVEYELAAYNPGTSRTHAPIIEIRNKCVGLHELLADLIDMIDERMANEKF